MNTTIIFMEFAGAVIVFVAGTLVGAHNSVTVDSAIAHIREAEAQAQAILSKITAHKTS